MKNKIKNTIFACLLVMTFLLSTINVSAVSKIGCCYDSDCESIYGGNAKNWFCIEKPDVCTLAAGRQDCLVAKTCYYYISGTYDLNLNNPVPDNLCTEGDGCGCMATKACGFCWYEKTFCEPGDCRNDLTGYKNDWYVCMYDEVNGVTTWKYVTHPRDGNPGDCSSCPRVNSRLSWCPEYEPLLFNNSYNIFDSLVSYFYNPLARKIEVVTKINSTQNATSRQFFDGLGRQIQSQSVLGDKMIVSNTNYDLLGRTNATSKPYEMTAVNAYTSPVWSNNLPYGYSVIDYDVLGRPTKIIAPGGNFITNSYSITSEGFVTSTTDELNRITKFTYDAYGNLINVQEPDGNITRYQYDVLNRLIKTTDAKGNNITYAYNGLGQLANVTHPDEGTTKFTYDVLGNLKTKQIASGEIITYTYDGLSRITKEDYPDNTLDVIYSYDSYMGITPPTNLNYPKGKLIKISSAYETDVYFYDAKGWLGKEDKTIDGKNFILDYSYDDANNLIELKVTNSTGTTLNKVNYQYDQLSRIKKVLFNGNEISNYNYSANNLIREQKYSNNIVMSFAYSIRDRLEQISSSIFNKYYVYDKSGNIIQENISGTITARYTFDLNDRLNVTIYPDLGITNNYTYDKTGNRIKLNNIDYTIAPVNNRITSDSQGYNYSYDVRGNLINKSKTGESNIYLWDSNNRLIRSTTTKGIITTRVISYYNYKGDRIKKIENNFVTHYIYDSAGNLVLEITPEHAPLGNLDSVTCEGNVYGWACDPDKSNQPLIIHFYKNGAYDAGGTFLGDITANISGESAIANECGGNANHRFIFQIPSGELSSTTSVYAYAIGINSIGALDGNNPQLWSSPKNRTECPFPTKSTA